MRQERVGDTLAHSSSALPLLPPSFWSGSKRRLFRPGPEGGSSAGLVAHPPPRDLGPAPPKRRGGAYSLIFHCLLGSPLLQKLLHRDLDSHALVDLWLPWEELKHRNFFGKAGEGKSGCAANSQRPVYDALASQIVRCEKSCKNGRLVDAAGNRVLCLTQPSVSSVFRVRGEA